MTRRMVFDVESIGLNELSREEVVARLRSALRPERTCMQCGKEMRGDAGLESGMPADEVPASKGGLTSFARCDCGARSYLVLPPVPPSYGAGPTWTEIYYGTHSDRHVHILDMLPGLPKAIRDLRHE